MRVVGLFFQIETSMSMFCHDGLLQKQMNTFHGCGTLAWYQNKSHTLTHVAGVLNDKQLVGDLNRDANSQSRLQLNNVFVGVKVRFLGIATTSYIFTPRKINEKIPTRKPPGSTLPWKPTPEKTNCGGLNLDRDLKVGDLWVE